MDGIKTDYNGSVGLYQDITLVTEYGREDNIGTGEIHLDHNNHVGKVYPENLDTVFEINLANVTAIKYNNIGIIESVKFIGSFRQGGLSFTFSKNRVMTLEEMNSKKEDFLGHLNPVNLGYFNNFYREGINLYPKREDQKPFPYSEENGIKHHATEDDIKDALGRAVFEKDILSKTVLEGVESMLRIDKATLEEVMEDFPSAEKANFVSNEHHYNILSELSVAIENAALEGLTEVMYNGKLSDSIRKFLENKGYDVKEINEETFSISWER